MLPRIIQFSKKRLLVFILDIALIAAAFSLAFLIRFDFGMPVEFIPLFKQGLIVVLLVKPFIFLVSGLYQNIWRYASVQDGLVLFKFAAISSVVSIFFLMYLRHFAPYPRSIFLLDGFLLFSFLAASRLIWRIYRENSLLRNSELGLRTLVVGAGDAGSMLLKEIRRQGNAAYNVVGFVDDAPGKQGMRLHGVPVLGTTKQLDELIKAYKIENVIIAMPSAGSKVIKNIVDSCKHTNVTFKTLPGIGELIDGSLSVSQIKNVEIEDLLGRDPVVLDHELIGRYLTGKRVLVTGAAGSIGSEICRQVARFKPQKLVLFDQAETPLYEIEKELMSSFPELRLYPLIADVRDSVVVETIFEEFMPEVVFHAAAYKHVPMMEYNPAQAVMNNIFGSCNVADAAHRFKVANMVMISTDKAVNPTNVMGATKRGAEIYVQALSRNSKTKFTTVRFGNVLGSNGSVIPLFKEQIAKGGPITVTDKRIIRYFMTIPEATQLVLQAGSIGTGSEILVLDMGDPVRIVDLAEELIRLSGLIPYEDIDIVFTGLRPGEKLFEELLIEGEGVMPTSHQKIKVIAPAPTDMDEIRTELSRLLGAARANDVDAVLESLKRLVPEFRPSYVFQGEAPQSFQRVRPDLYPANEGQTKAKILPLRNKMTTP